MAADESPRIERFDKQNLKRVRDRIEALLDEHGFPGVGMKVRDVSYTEGDAHITVVAKIDGAETREFRALKKAAEAFDLDLDRVVDGMRLVEYVPRRRAYPFTALDRNGHPFKMTPRAAVRCFGRKPGELQDFVRAPRIHPASEEEPAIPPEAFGEPPRTGG